MYCKIVNHNGLLLMKKFTLVELLFVIGILITLIGIGFSVGSNVMKKSAQKTIEADLKQLKVLVNAYHKDTGTYPINSHKEILIKYIYAQSINNNDSVFLDPFDDSYRLTKHDKIFKLHSENQH